MGERPTKNNHRHLKILLFQARLPDDSIGHHERQCFVKHTGLRSDQIVPHDLLSGPPTIAEVRSYDALMVGGSGDFYVSKRNLPHFASFLDLLREVVSFGHPTFASCFGYQSLVTALGGEVIFDPEHTEVGTFELELSFAAKDDPLFSALPARFQTQMGHKDRARIQPDGIPNLASSERCPLQCLRIPGKPIWGTQFHPELDLEANRVRYMNYLDGYMPHLTTEERDEVLSGFCESPEASEILSRFLDVVFPA